MIPELTTEQRMANLEKAMILRKERAEIRRALSEGRTNVLEVISLARGGHAVYAGMRVRQLINAMPDYGFKRTQALMEEIGIAENKRVGGLGEKQAMTKLG